MAIKKHGQIIKQIYRIWSHYLGLVIRNTRISANQITLSRILLVILASYFILDDFYLTNILAAFLLILFSFFDALDGSVAIMKEEKSIIGGWLDPQVDRLGFLVLFLVIAYKLSASHELYIYLCFYILVMFYYRGLIPADIRLKDKFIKLRDEEVAQIDNIGSGISKNYENPFFLNLIKKTHMQISPHTHNVVLYIAIGLVIDYLNLVMIFMAVYISFWYLWENYKVIKKAKILDSRR